MFIKTLRDNPKVRLQTPTRTDWFDWAQCFRRDYELKKERVKGTITKDMLDRLTRPIVRTYKASDLRKLNPPQEYRYMGHKLDRSFF